MGVIWLVVSVAIRAPWRAHHAGAEPRLGIGFLDLSAISGTEVKSC
jgi:hypothetical protein